MILTSHLSKCPSDLKQNGTQENTPFSSTVFNTLSHGVIHFVSSGSSKKHLLTGWDFFTANQKFLFNGFWSYHLQQNETRERVWKTVSENGVFSCVPFCLRSLGHSERCDLAQTNLLWLNWNFFNPGTLWRWTTGMIRTTSGCVVWKSSKSEATIHAPGMSPKAWTKPPQQFYPSTLEDTPERKNGAHTSLRLFSEVKCTVSFWPSFGPLLLWNTQSHIAF